MFIPPEGAMQFEVTSHPYNEQNIGMRLWMTPSPEWANAPSPRAPGCSCRQFFDVIAIGNIEGVAISKLTGHAMVVCACIGRIIE